MPEETKEAVKALRKGDSATFTETITSLLHSKAMDALGVEKINVAQKMFNEAADDDDDDEDEDDDDTDSNKKKKKDKSDDDSDDDDDEDSETKDENYYGRRLGTRKK